MLRCIYSRTAEKAHSRKPAFIHPHTYPVPGSMTTPRLFNELPRRVLLGNWASGVPIPGNCGMKLRLSEVAELARLKPLQYQLEGTRLKAGSAGEGMLHDPDRE